MNNHEYYADFLHCCRTQKIKKLHIAEACMIATPAAGDFGSIVIEFEHDIYFLTSRYLDYFCENPINEFSAQKISSLEDISSEISADDIYVTLSYEDDSAVFVTEMTGKDGYFDGIELKANNYFLFLSVDCPVIVVIASYDEEFKYFCYPHLFGEGPVFFSSDEYVELFPEG